MYLGDARGVMVIVVANKHDDKENTFTNHIYFMRLYKEYLALNKQQWVIFYEI